MAVFVFTNPRGLTPGGEEVFVDDGAVGMKSESPSWNVVIDVVAWLAIVILAVQILRRFVLLIIREARQYRKVREQVRELLFVKAPQWGIDIRKLAEKLEGRSVPRRSGIPLRQSDVPVRQEEPIHRRPDCLQLTGFPPPRFGGFGESVEQRAVRHENPRRGRTFEKV